MTATPRTFNHIPGARLFSARYGGVCTECQDEFDVEDDVAYNDQNEIVCASCDTQKAERPQYGVCTRCFLTKTRTGACGCDA